MKQDWIGHHLEKIKNKSLNRHINTFSEAGGIINIEGKRMLNYSSNDYLNLSKHPLVLESSIEALKKYGTGSTSSRLVCGSLDIHHELEEKLAKHKNYPSALLFGTGYMTSLGVIPVIANKSDLIFSDRLVHSCILDGIKLSGAKHIRFKHNDIINLSDRLKNYHDHKGKKIIIVESLYSMDGDIAPLKEIAQIAEKYNAILMVDEAHATGTIGRNGKGCICNLEIENYISIAMGTLSKGLAGFGGFITCSKKLRQLIIQHASTLIYTTAPPPSVVGSSLGALKVLEQEPQLGEILQKKAHLFRERLNHSNINTLKSDSHIIPIIIGDNNNTLHVAKKLKEDGILVGAIRPPTVPEGTARLRISISLAHSDSDLEYTANKIMESVKI